MNTSEDPTYRHGATWLSIIIGISLLFWFARFLPLSSIDLPLHYLVVDEIMRYGGMRPAPIPNLGPMSQYPAASHWLAAILGWIGGSGLVGMLMVAIASVFAAYVLIGHLVGVSLLRMTLLLAAAVLLLPTHSLIGHEVFINFFYPQLVADVVYLASLLWLSRLTEMWKQAILILVLGSATMWIQPLISVHLFAAGLSLMAFQTIERWLHGKRAPRRDLLLLTFTTIASVLAIVMNPLFQVMRTISSNDGALAFGYSHMLWIALACAGLGGLNLLGRLMGRGNRLDAVLGSAVIAAVALLAVQFVMLRLHAEGSNYALKKHMFIIFTLGVINAIRLVAGWIPSIDKPHPASQLLVPVVAGVVSCGALADFVTPVAPVVNAINYANNAAALNFPRFAPGNTVAEVASQHPFVNWMITMSSFQRPLDQRAWSWLNHNRISDQAEYAMVQRTAGLEKYCKERYAESASYVVVDARCARSYQLGDPIDFRTGGASSLYAKNGWWGIEGWGTWTVGNTSAGVLLKLQEDVRGPLTLTVNARPFLSKSHPTQVAFVVVNNQKIATWTYTANEEVSKSAVIPAELVKDGVLHIVFETIDSVSPSQVDPASLDKRVMGLGVTMLMVEARKAPAS